jgi:two-component system osmolarity sensor histidine kinase EnvZ
MPGPSTSASGRAGRALRSVVDASAPALATLKSWYKSAVGLMAEKMPKGLYARALIIIIAPIVVLEGVIAFVFMERHWQNVTRRLSETTARDIAALIDFYDKAETSEYDEIIRIARERLSLSMQILPPGDLPEARQKPFFDLLDRALSKEISRQVKRPFWIDTVGQSRHVEIRVQHTESILRFLAVRTQTYASNSHIFLLWMVGSSVILLTVAILFLRNQIRPILRLADAADAFGKGRPMADDFRCAAPARCVRRQPPSSKCAAAFASTSSSARPCSRASATIFVPCSRGSSSSSPSWARRRRCSRSSPTSTKWPTCLRTISRLRAATAARRRR